MPSIPPPPPTSFNEVFKNTLSRSEDESSRLVLGVITKNGCDFMFWVGVNITTVLLFRVFVKCECVKCKDNSKTSW